MVSLQPAIVSISLDAGCLGAFDDFRIVCGTKVHSNSKGNLDI